MCSQLLQLEFTVVPQNLTKEISQKNLMGALGFLRGNIF